MLLLLTTLFAQEANAGWGMSTEAGQATISNVDGDGSIDLNTTLDLWTPKFLVQADVLSLAKSLAVEDRIDFGFNAYYGLGRQRINSDWGGSLQLGTRFDVTQYQLNGQAASDYSIALEPRMGIELRPASVEAKGKRGKRKRKVKGQNRIAGGLYLMPSIGVAQISTSSGGGIQQNTELLVGSTLQLSVWID